MRIEAQDIHCGRNLTAHSKDGAFMCRITFRVAIALLALLCHQGAARAALLIWTIDLPQSHVLASIPDQSVDLGLLGTATVGIRNQEGNTWTANKIPIGGQFKTTFANGELQFLPGAPGEMFGSPTGHYRPNRASYSGGTVNPDGTASGGTFSNISYEWGVSGGKVQVNGLDVAMVNGYSANFTLSSGPIIVGNLVGIPGGAGIRLDATGLVGVDGLLGTFFPDFIESGATIGSGETLPAGSLSGPAAPGATVTMNLPLFYDTTVVLSGISLTAHVTGVIHATTVLPVPEPASISLAAFGLVALLGVWRRRARHGAV